MSTRSMQQSNSAAAVVALSHLPSVPAEPDAAFDTLIAMSDVRSSDHVVVIGRQLSACLIALANLGCRSAMGLDPSAVHIPKDRADVVWVTGVREVDATLMALVSRMEQPRLVVVESGATSPGKLLPLLQCLREMGLVEQSYRRVGGRVVIWACRTEWLQWMA